MSQKEKKKTSLFTWLVLLSILYVIYSIGSQEPQETTANKTNTVTQVKKTEQKPLIPTWETTSSKDRMSGDISYYATSPITHASPRMSFPYNDVYSWIGVGCDKKSEWAYFGFSESPNLIDDETRDQYNFIKTRIKWDNTIDSVSLTQDWGSEFLHFVYRKYALKNITASKTVLLQLHWYRNDETYFEYSLEGSSEAIANIRKKCQSL